MIDFNNFGFRYDSLKSQTLINIDLQINKGEKVLIAGPSGSGKSTLAHCLNGLIPFSKKGEITGKLVIAGFEPYKKSIYEISDHVGTILQDQDGQFVALSVGEDVAFAYENNNMDKAKMEQGVHEALEAVDMLPYINETPHNLSGGQKQRVAMAGILATQTDILLFDEPLANLDPASGQRAMEIIDKIHKETDKTIIIIEHRIEDVLAFKVDRMIVMNQGEIVANGHPDDLLVSNVITDNGLREPLYIEALKKAGITLRKEDKISNFNEAKKYSQELGRFETSLHPYNLEIKKQEDILALKGIHFSYEKKGPQILKNVDFHIKKGEIVALLGNNGAGKSTLLKVISGLVKQDQGELFYGGQPMNDWSIRKRSEKIGYVMQNPNHMILKNMIFDEVAFGLLNKGVSKEDIRLAVEKALKTCGLYAYRKWPVSALSYGQKKRLTIASILAMGTDIIILDEPTAGQDYENYREFMSFLAKVKSQGVSILIITHDMHLSLEYADRTVVLSDGQIIAENQPYQVLSDEETIQRGNLKETSLSRMAKLCGLKNVEGFVGDYIADMRKEHQHE